MAIKSEARQSQKALINLFTIILLGWLILFGWGVSLWSMNDFTKAEQSIHRLANQQATTVIQFRDDSIAEYIKSWLKIPAFDKLNQKLNQSTQSIKKKLNPVLPVDHFELNSIANDLLKISKQVWTLMHLTSQVLLIKLMLLIAAIPLFMLAMTAGLIDGLNQRAIRTASLGRESSYVFHQLNRYSKRGLLLLLAMWLAIPLSIKPAWMLVPVSIFLSIVISITASRFKKYL